MALSSATTLQLACESNVMKPGLEKEDVYRLGVLPRTGGPIRISPGRQASLDALANCVWHLETLPRALVVELELPDATIDDADVYRQCWPSPGAK